MLFRDTPAFTPGPGAYKAPSSFGRKPFRGQRQKQGHHKAKVPIHKSQMPPSVPSKAHSYGYEETPEGQLRPQPPPQGSIFTGDKTSRVGPGQYDPSVGAIRPDPKAAVFGRGPEIDRTALLLGTSVAPATKRPWGYGAGPGAYTPQQPQAPHKKHRVPDIINLTAATAIAALQAKLRSSRHAAHLEASAVEEVVKATLKHGTVEVTSGSKGLRGGSPVGPGYYTNLPSAFDKVLKKPASKIYGETCGHLPHLP
ncbi:hypothetical protein ABBQ32_009855 [Trebouxia sp. C0010 RCD-2024]